VGGVVLLPNTGLPSLNSAGGFGLGGVLAVFEPFPFFLSSSFFLFSASNALTAAACCVFSSSKFDPVLAIDSVKVASWPGNSLSSSSALPVIESGVVSPVFSSELPSTTSLRGMIMFRILSAVLRRSILVERRKVLAGALWIECVELSRTAIYGD
jgi:hypothetical protein